LGEQIKKNEMGRACGTYGGREEVHIGFWWGNRLLVRPRHRWEGVDWIGLAQDRDK
jgi:hypothetical protein